MVIWNDVIFNIWRIFMKGKCVTIEHPDRFKSGTQGGGHSTGGGSGTSGSSYSSQEQHIQQVSSALSGNVLGGAYHDGRKNRDKDDGINYQVKGIVSQLQKYGFKDAKGIVLSDCALEDRDIGCSSVFVKTVRDLSCNLTIIDLSNNKLGLDAAEGIFWMTRVDHDLPKHVKSINLSNNLLDDKCAEHIAYYLTLGVHPSLKHVDVSDNQITATGTGYLAKGLEVVTQDLKIVFETVKGFSIDALKATMKQMLSIAHSNGISTKETLTTDETIAHCIKGGVNVGLNIGTGYLKCTNNIVKAYNYKDITLGDVVSEILGLYAQPLKGVLNFVCITEKTFFSVVDENFANCLVGVDSLLEE
jgi:hypothetical protein